MREREEREGGVSFYGRKEFTVFISNLPDKLDKYGLKGIFTKAGKVSDVYIPEGKSGGLRRRYGFVRFWNWHEAMRSIQRLNNTNIRGCKISVSIAKYAKGRISHQMKATRKGLRQAMKRSSQVWRKKHYATGEAQAKAPERISDGQEKVLMSVKGQINEDFIPWLSRSSVCTSEEPRDLGSLSSAILSGYGQCTKICALSGFKFILTFQSQDEMEAALQTHEELDIWFSEFKRWDKYDCCTSRKVWIEVVGVPPHGWKWENFKAIAELWGYLICLGKPISRTDTFESMRLLIETDVLFFIEGDFILTIEDMGFRVIAREVGLVSQMV